MKNSEVLNVVDVLSDKFDFSSIAGLDRAKDFIRDHIVEPFRNPELAKIYDLKVGAGLILYGPPGTGKTSLAKATANEIDAAYYEISIDIVQGFPGDAERKIDELFFAAKSNRSVIFLDEVEILLKREIGMSSVMNRVKGKLLQIMGDIFAENNPIIVLGATNRPWELDPAFLRPGRFGFMCEVPLPDKNTIYQLLRIKNHRRNCVLDVTDREYREIAELFAEKYFSGADIEDVLNKTALEIYKFCNQNGGIRKIVKRDYLRQIELSNSSVDPKYLKTLDEWKMLSNLRR